MGLTEDVRARLSAYLAEAEEVEAAGKPWDGLFGFGSRPADHPCHTRFVETLVQTVRDAPGDLTPPEALAAAGLILEAAVQHPEPASVHYTLVAAQGAVLPLLPLLTPGDSAALLARYRDWYPRRTLLPVQKLVVKGLERKGK